MTDSEHPGMAVVLDVNELERATDFWSAALGFPKQRPITQFMVLRPDDAQDHRPNLILQRVPEAKAGKNRAHLDLFFPLRDEARDRLLAFGARLLQEEPNCIGSHCWYLNGRSRGKRVLLRRRLTA